MELKQYFKILQKKIWILLLIPIAAACISGYVSLFVLNPVFESNTTLYVINKGQGAQTAIALNDIMAGQSLVKDYRELIKSRLVTTETIKDLGLKGISSETLAERISVNSKNDTRIIEIKVQDTQPERARDIADKLAEVFIDKVIELMKVDTVGIVDKAILPARPIKPRPAINILITAFSGIITSLGIIFLLEYLDDTVKTAEDVEKQLGITVLGTIPALEMK